jgi:hypothetical protein
LPIKLQNIDASQRAICQLNCKIIIYHRGHLPIELQNINVSQGAFANGAAK